MSSATKVAPKSKKKVEPSKPAESAPQASAPAADAPSVPAPEARKPINPEDFRESSSKPRSMAAMIAESRDLLKHPVPPGMKIFESPEGYCMLGEVNKSHVWCRYANDGAGANINPRR